jgi:L-asparaginase II
MRAHPDLVHGRSGVDSALMAAEEGLVAKVGAEGVLAVGLADGRGLALKVRDGGGRALGPAAVAAVRTGLGLDAASGPLEALAAAPLANGRGQAVGRLEAVVDTGR